MLSSWPVEIHTELLSSLKMIYDIKSDQLFDFVMIN